MTAYCYCAIFNLTGILYSPGSWNHKEHGMFKVQQVSKVLQTPPALEKLRQTANMQKEDRAKTPEKEEEEKKKKKVEIQEEILHGRTLQEVSGCPLLAP